VHNQVDPQLEPGLELFPEFILTPETLLEVREMSVQMRAEMIAQAPKIDDIVSEEHQIPGPVGDPQVRIGIHKPADRPEKLPGFLWIHGGGYVMGSIDSDDILTIPPLVKAVNCVAVTVDYRLAPEHPYPAPLDDCYAALKWMFDHADELGIDPTRIAIGGASAGGGLAAGLALLVRDRAEMNIMFQLLVYPMIDDRNTKQASETLPDTLVWSRQHNLFGWTSYLGMEPGGDDVPIYAAAARATDLSNLPPAYISVGDLDLFADENIVYARHLTQAGVPTELHVYPGAYHGFDGFAPEADISLRSKTTQKQALKAALHKQGGIIKP